MKSKSLPLLSFLFVSFFTPLLAQNFDVYISDAGGFTQEPWQILKFDQNGGNGEVFISDHLSWPQDIFFIESDNTVLVSNLNTNVISKFNATTGDFIGEFATGIGGPTRMELGPDSLLYVLQWTGNGKVKRYKLDGTFVDDFTTAVVDNSIGLAWDTVGNLYVSSYNGRYVKNSALPGQILANSSAPTWPAPTNIWFGENGDLFVSDWNAGSVKRFDSQGNYIGVFISGVPQVEGVDFFPNGDIAIGVGGASTVKVYSPEGNFIKNLIPAGALNLQVPNAVVFRPVAPTSALEVFKDAVFVTPSVGNLFQVSNPDALQPKQFFEVYNATGMLVMKFNFSDSTTWDASNLANGIYHLTAKLPDGTVGRQKVVVQR